MEKAAETLASKSQVDTTFNIADKKRAKTKKISEEGIKPPDTSDNSLAPKLNSIQNAKIVVESKESNLKQHKASLTQRNEVNLVIV